MKIKALCVASPLHYKKLSEIHRNDTDKDLLYRWNKVKHKGKVKGDRE